MEAKVDFIITCFNTNQLITVKNSLIKKGYTFVNSNVEIDIFETHIELSNRYKLFSFCSSEKALEYNEKGQQYNFEQFSWE